MGGIIGGGPPAPPPPPPPPEPPKPVRAKLPEDDAAAKTRRINAAQSQGRASTLLGDGSNDTLG